VRKRYDFLVLVALSFVLSGFRKRKEARDAFSREGGEKALLERGKSIGKRKSHQHYSNLNFKTAQV